MKSHARFCSLYEKEEKKSYNGIYICECNRTFENPQSMNSHFSRCLVHREDKTPINNRGGGGWSKGLTKENNVSILKMSKSLSESRKGKEGKLHTQETKIRISEKRIEFLENNPGSNISWIEVFNGEKIIKVQGKWELKVADWLNKSSIKWDRKRIQYGNRFYTPDFFIDDETVIEVKGWMKERDLYKMKTFLESNPKIKILLIEKEEINKIEELKIEELKELREKYNLNTINMDMFKSYINKK